MITIAKPDIEHRISRDNPWWQSGGSVPEAALPRRVYFPHFVKLALNFSVRRATIMLGPRRVGKTVIAKQLVNEAIGQGLRADDILYAAIDAPVYSGMPLEAFVELLPNIKEDTQKLIIFDEIQYLRNWEIHLKDLVDSFPKIKFVATGSAAAALVGMVVTSVLKPLIFAGRRPGSRGAPLCF